jgi:hypothetical protein
MSPDIAVWRASSAAVAAEFDLAAFRGGRKLAVFGAGFALEQLRISGFDLAPSMVFDDDPGYSGRLVSGIPVVLSDELRRVNPRDWCFVISAYGNGAVRDILRKLAARGFRFLRDVVDISVLHWKQIRTRLRDQLGIAPEDDLFAAVHSLATELPLVNHSSIAGTALMVHLLKAALQRGPGHVCEFGAYQGGNAFIVNLLLFPWLSGRRYYLADAFEGLTSVGAHDPQDRAGEFSDAVYEEVLDRFAMFPAVRVVKGDFADTMPAIAAEPFCLGYVDCDLYEPARLCLRFLQSTLVPGGYILLHDYVDDSWVYPPYVRAPFRGITRAVAEFLDRTPMRMVVFPGTTHLVLVP